MEIFFWSLVASLAVLTLQPWSWSSGKPVAMKPTVPCRCFWCKS